MAQDSWQDRYLPALVRNAKINLCALLRYLARSVTIMLHGVLPHAPAKEPSEPLPKITGSATIAYDLARAIYDEVDRRITGLENKAFKLLSYVTAVLTLNFLLLTINLSTPAAAKIVLSVSVILLSIAAIISFRCINVKDKLAVFVGDIYDFSVKPPACVIDEKKIAKAYLDSAVFNTSVADNTADVLKAARHFFSIGFFVILLTFLVFHSAFFHEPDQKQDDKSEEMTTRMDALDNQVRSLEFRLFSSSDSSAEVGTIPPSSDSEDKQRRQTSISENITPHSSLEEENPPSTESTNGDMPMTQ